VVDLATGPLRAQLTDGATGNSDGRTLQQATTLFVDLVGSTAMAGELNVTESSVSIRPGRRFSTCGQRTILRGSVGTSRRTLPLDDGATWAALQLAGQSSETAFAVGRLSTGFQEPLHPIVGLVVGERGVEGDGL
jgi:AMMECR1 domain-containing protein